MSFLVSWIVFQNIAFDTFKGEFECSVCVCCTQDCCVFFLLTWGSETHITSVCSSVNNSSEQETEQPISTQHQTASNEVSGQPQTCLKGKSRLLRVCLHERGEKKQYIPNMHTRWQQTHINRFKRFTKTMRCGNEVQDLLGCKILEGAFFKPLLSNV